MFGKEEPAMPEFRQNLATREYVARERAKRPDRIAGR
jgi:hypothetical protein